MKRTFLLKTMLLLCALVAGSSSVWAADPVTITSFKASDANAGTLNNWSLVGNPDYATAGGGYYKLIANTMAIETPSITWSNYSSITITITARTFGGPSNTQKKISVMQGTTELNSYSPGGTSLVASSALSISPSTGKLTITCAGASSSKGSGVSEIVIKGVPSSPIAALSTTSLAFGRVKAGASKNLTFTVTPANLTGDLTIASNNDKYTVSPTSIAKATTTAQTITVTAAPEAVDNDMTGEISISGGGLSESKTVSLSCIVRDPAANDGTAAKPYTVSEALVLIDEEGSNKTGIYVSGIISQIDEVNISNKNATYWISDDGSTTNQLQAFRGKYLNNADFTSEDQISLLDQVVVVGDLTKYNSTYEFATGNYIYSQTADTRLSADLAWSADAVTFEKDAASYSLPSLTNPNSIDVTYTITGTAGLASEAGGVISVNTSIVGTATVTATFAGNATYKPASVSYTITVVRVYTVAEVIDGTATGTDILVKGFVVGCYNGGNKNNFGRNGDTDTNLAIADDPAESVVGNTVAVQLPSGTIRTNFNVKDNTELIGFGKILIKADAISYITTIGLKNTDEISMVGGAVTVSNLKYATFSSGYALNFNGSGIEVYKAASDGSKVNLTKIDDGIVPANTGVVLYSETVKNNVAIPVATTSAAGDFSGNELVGINIRSVVNATESTKTNYILSNEAAGVGFYKATDGKYLGAHKAYLSTTNTPTAPDFLAFDFNNETTGVSEMKSTKLAGEVYDLQGRKVANPTKGLYIVNGKKVVIK